MRGKCLLQLDLQIDFDLLANHKRTISNEFVEWNDDKGFGDLQCKITIECVTNKRMMNCGMWGSCSYYSRSTNGLETILLSYHKICLVIVLPIFKA